MANAVNFRLTLIAPALAAMMSVVQAAPPVGPVDVKVINTPDKPVPVTVIPQAPSTPAVCRLSMSAPSTSQFIAPTVSYTDSQQFPFTGITCDPGVTILDVERVVFHPLAVNLLHFTITLISGVDDTRSFPVASVSSGTPDLTLSRSFRLDKTTPSSIYLLYAMHCGSGSAATTTCRGEMHFVGKKVNP